MSDTTDDQFDYTPLSVREGWTPLEQWTTPRDRLNGAMRRSLREWLEIYYPLSGQMTPDAYSVLRTFTLINDEALNSGERLASGSEVRLVLYTCEAEERVMLALIDFTLVHLGSKEDQEPVHGYLDIPFFKRVGRSGELPPREPGRG